MRREDAEAELAHLWAKLLSLLSRAEEVADRIALLLAARGIPPVAGAPPLPREGRQRKSRFADPRFELLARPGVGHVRLGAFARGTVPVSIDGAETFELTPALANLLDELAGGTETDDDGFPAFRSYKDLAAALSARRGRPIGVRAVVVRISRLREHLLDAGNVSPKLVETADGRGARFRIRRRTDR